MKNILLIVDDLKFRSQMINCLRLNTFHPISANNYSEALVLVQEQYPNLIITDLDVFKPDSYDILKELRQLTFLSQIPILVLTNQIDSDFQLKLWQLGITLFSPKNLKIDLIVQIISDSLKQNS